MCDRFNFFGKHAFTETYIYNYIITVSLNDMYNNIYIDATNYKTQIDEVSQRCQSYDWLLTVAKQITLDFRH